jgi:signal transduction histidine kinase
MNMKTYRSINRQVRLLGLPLQDMFLLLFVMSLAIVLGIVLNFFIPMSKYYFWSVLVSSFVVYLFLRRLNYYQHPSLVFSYLSWRFWQPRKLEVNTGYRRAGKPGTAGRVSHDRKPVLNNRRRAGLHVKAKDRERKDRAPLRRQQS